MPLFGGRRDAKLIKSFNRELINTIIDTPIAYYKIIAGEQETNTYDESLKKSFYHPVLFASIIDRSDRDHSEQDGAGQDYNQTATFALLHQDLQRYNIIPEPGDVIEWDNEYYEIDTLGENQYFMGKNHDTSFRGDTHGLNMSIVLGAHVTRKNMPNIENVRAGVTPPPIKLGDD